ncbi:hypothetical protein [Nocardioides sp. LML1-1-1.1]|uniref:hypothetical protein n=1 Tax=Nocardioides sp. LML1-1-1.1 TaxID=3135248 RepID=UPI0034365CF8
MAPPLADVSASGLLPIGVDFPAGTVTFARMVDRDFSETWYDDTVRTCRSDTVATLPLRVFLQQSADLPPAAAPRLIGHVSRCGSTLLSNLLALRPTTMVLKEPDFVTDVAHRVALAPRPADRQRHAELLAALLRYTCHVANAHERTCVVKVTSWTTPVVMASLPRSAEATWLLQWRQAHAVVASNLASPPGWGEDAQRGGAVRRAVGLPPSSTDGLELYASVWAHVVAAFAGAPDGVRYRALGYDDFAADKEESLLAAEAWFGLGGGRRPPGYAEESVRYSKGAVGEQFDRAGDHRRPRLDAPSLSRVEELTAAADAWLRTSARRLL